MKLKHWLTPLICVITVAAIACTAMFVRKNQSPKTVTLSDDAFMDALPLDSLNGEQEFRQSDIPGIFYTRDPVGFYEWKDGKLNPVKDMVSVPVSMNIFNSAQKISFTLHYVRRGIQVTGFGEYSMDPAKADTVLISDYYFIHAITLPPSVKVDRNKNCLLLIDSKKEPVEDPYRIYEESFFFSTQSGKVNDRYILDGSRIIDPVTGGKDRNYAMFTTAQVRNATSKRTLYFRELNQGEAGTAQELQLRSIQGTYNSTAASNIGYKYARDTDNGLLTVRKNKTGTGFDIYWKDKAVLSFDGDFEKDYIRDGDWLLPLNGLESKDTIAITNIATKAIYELPLKKRLKEISAFTVSPDGTRVILAGIPVDPAKTGGNQQSILFYNYKDGASKYLLGTALFRNQLPLMGWIDNDTFAYNCTNFDTNKPQLCIARFTDAMKSNTVEVTKQR